MRAIGAGILFILTMAGASPSHADQAHSCLITIGMNRWNPGTCTVEEEGNTLTVEWPGAGKIHYHATLERSGGSGNQANASWTRVREDSTTTEALGRLNKVGDCWINNKADICFAINAEVATSEFDDDPYEDEGSEDHDVAPNVAPSGNASSFRGIQLGMTKAQIRAALNDEFSLSSELPSPDGNPKGSDATYAMTLFFALGGVQIPNGMPFGSQYILNGDNKVCGEMSFADGHADRMRLGQCYFDIQGSITISDFARQIIDTYGLEDGMEGSTRSIKGPYGPIGYVQYTGVKRETSERFTAAVNDLTHVPTLTIEKIPSINFN